MLFKKLVIIQILASAVFFVNTAAAAPLTFNVDGVISDSSDQPLQSASVTFTVQVKDSAETCLLYQESFPVSMTGSNGYFSLVVGKQANAVSGGSTLDKVFSNSGAAIAGQSCTYTPTSKTETRKIIVSFDEGSGSQIFSSQEIQSVPYAVAAGEATKFTTSLSGDVTGTQTATVVGKIKGLPVDTTGIADGKILKYQSGTFVVSDDLQGTSGIVSLNGLTGGTQTFSAVDITGSVLAPAWVSSGSAHTLKIPMASGTSVTGGLISNSDFANFSTKITALTGDITASGSGTVNAVIGTGKVTSSHILDGTINGADVDFTATNSATSDLVLKDSGTGKFATFACSTPNYVLTWTAAGWSCQAPATTGLPLSGGTMTGAINMGGNNLLNVGNLTMVSGGYLSLPNTAINGASAGQVWYDAGVIKYYDGSAVKTVSTGSSGMSNALSTGQIWVGNVSGGAEARSLNGDISSTSATGAVVVNKTTTGTANTILSLDGSSVGTMSGLALVNTGTVTLSASTASSNYSLKLPAASPTGTQIMQVDAFGNLTWIATPSFTMPALSAGKIWIGNASNGIAAQTMGGDATIDQSGNLTLANTVTAGTYTKVTTDAKGRVTTGAQLAASDITTALTYTPVNKAGDTMGGDLVTQNVSMAANKYLKLSSNTTDGTVAGQVWYDGGIIKYFDGTTTKSLGVSGAGITNFNGLSAGSQTLAVGTSGNAPAFSSATSTHTLNIPMASASGSVTAGLISNADYVSFAGKQSNALAAGDVWIGNASGGAQSRTLGGDITVDPTGNVALKNTGTVGTYYKVTTDAQGRVVSGSASLSSTDLPTLTDGKIWIGNSGNAAIANTMGGDATISNTGILSLKNTGTVGTYFKVTTDAQGRVTSGFNLAAGDITTALGYTPANGASAFINGGNTFAGNATIGVNDAFTLGFKTGNSVRMTIDATGNVGIGTIIPGYPLSVNGTIESKTGGFRFPDGSVQTTAASTSANTILNGGNTFGSATTIGTNDANTLGFKTGGTTRVTIDTAGKVGIGTASPNATLDMSTQTDAMILPKGTTVARPGTLVSGMIRYNTTNNALEYYDGTTWYTVGNALGFTPLNKAGDAMSGTLSLGSNDLTNAGNITMSANKYLTLSTNSTSGTTAGQVWYDASGVIKYYDGSAVRTLGVSGAGITSLNGLTTSSQTFFNGTTGNSPAFVSSGGGHTLNIPLASASGTVTQGLISNADYVSFNSKQSNTLPAGNMWVGNSSGGAQAFALSGDIASINNTGAVVVNKTTMGLANTILALDGAGSATTYGMGILGSLSGGVTFLAPASGANYSLTFPNAQGSANQVLSNTGGGTLQWTTVLTPTSINNKATLSAGKFWVGNGSGAAVEVPMGGDATMDNAGNVTLNTVPVSKGGTGSTSIPVGSLVLGNGTSAISTLAGGTSGNVLFANASNSWSSVSPDTAGLVDKATAQTITGAKTFSGVTAISNGVLVNTSISLGAGTNTITAGNGNIAAGLGGTSTTGGGQIYAGAFTTSTSTIDFNKGNTQATSYDCTSGSINLTNMQSGGNYTLIVNSTTTAKCTLQDNGTSIPDTQFVPTNTTRVSGYSTVYKIFKHGSNVYLNWNSVGNSPGASFVNNGNTFGGNASIGLTDAFNLNFMTNAAVRMTINSAGNVGIGTTSPSGTLDVQGGTAGTSTAGAAINLSAQNGGSGGAVGGSINLTPGTGSSSFPGGSVIVTAINGQSGAISATNNMTNSYTASSASSTNPSYVLKLANSQNSNGNTALVETTVKNSNALFQEGYMGFVSVTGAANYSSDFVLGMQTGANAYTERLRIVGASGNVGIGTSTPSYSLDFTGKTDAIRLPAGTTAQQPANAAGLIRYNTTNSNIEFNNGSAWTALGAGGASISSLNGLTGTTQTLANSVSGTTPAFVSTGSTHTLNIPMANTTSVTAGLISKTEYDTFNSKMSSSLANGNIFVGNASGGAVGVAMTGDATISNTGALIVSKTTTGQANKILSLDGSGVATMLGLNLVNSGTVSLQAQTASSSYVLRLPASSPSANQIMVSDSSGNLSWQASPALGYTPVNKAGDTMTGTLEVSGNIQTNQGQVYASQNVVSSGSTVDFNTGNVQIVQSPGGATITLNNMKDGGSYTVIVTDSTSRQYTFNNCTNPHFVPANDLTTAGAQSIYTILKVTIAGATHCYISWVTGF